MSRTFHYSSSPYSAYSMANRVCLEYGLRKGLSEAPGPFHLSAGETLDAQRDKINDTFKRAVLTTIRSLPVSILLPATPSFVALTIWGAEIIPQTSHHAVHPCPPLSPRTSSTSRHPPALPAGTISGVLLAESFIAKLTASQRRRPRPARPQPRLS